MTSKKFYCPACGKKTFVRYVETESNNYLEHSIGRCDRESKCSYHYPPHRNKPLVNPKYILSEREPSYHKDELIGIYGNNYKYNHFVSFLLKHFAPVDVTHVIQKYFIGTTSHWQGATVFWQVDEKMNVCAGKVMLYDKNTGSRVKKPYVHINWMHSVLQMSQFVLQQCLFGIHNLCDYSKGSAICIVESEKTAIIMSVIYPSYLWLATGSKSNFKVELLMPLFDFKIIVFPDKTEYTNWNKKTEQFQKEGFNIACSKLLENKDLQDGDDLVDFLF